MAHVTLDSLFCSNHDALPACMIGTREGWAARKASWRRRTRSILTLCMEFKITSGRRVPLCCMLVAQSCPTLCDPMDCPWNSPGTNTGVGSSFLLHGIFPTQGSNPGLLHCRQIFFCLRHQGSPFMLGKEDGHVHSRADE